MKIVQGSLEEFAEILPVQSGRCEEAARVRRDSSRIHALKSETLAAWTMLANELLNLDEVLNK